MMLYTAEVSLNGETILITDKYGGSSVDTNIYLPGTFLSGLLLTALGASALTRTSGPS